MRWALAVGPRANRRLLEEILTNEEQHAGDLTALIQPRSNRQAGYGRLESGAERRDSGA